MFCPKCRDKFQDWVKTCPDCKVDLVAELPPASRPEVNPFKPVARFSPPLYKPGNKRCPNCGQHQGWYRAFGPWRWQFHPYSWKCARCQTVLRQDLVRYFTLVGLILIPLGVIAGVLASTVSEMALLIVLIPFAPILWWFGSIKRREE